MKDLTNEILELIRRTSTSLPADVEEQLKAAVEKEEPGSAARGALETIMKNVELARAQSTPICQDTGTPIFYVHYPEGWSTRKLKAQIREAMAFSAAAFASGYAVSGATQSSASCIQVSAMPA